MPDRIEKDLATIKVLAALLEDQAAALRKFTVKKIAREPELREEHQPNADGDVSIPAPELDEEEEPNERGSDAVDRRVEKIMSDLREQNLVDINDERAYENRKVSHSKYPELLQLIATRLRPSTRLSWPSICTSHTFAPRFTHASTAALYLIILRNYNENV